MKIILYNVLNVFNLGTKSEGKPTGAIPSLVYHPRVVIRTKPSNAEPLTISHSPKGFACLTPL